MKKIPVFGTPINPVRLAEQLCGASFCVSFFYRDKLKGQLNQIIRLTGKDQLLLIDQGAYSFWRSSGGQSPGDQYWLAYEAWAYDIMRRCPQAVAIAPDIIDGSEEDNHRLLREFLGGCLPTARIMPVWHLGDSLDYLDYLLECGFAYLGFGSSGKYGSPGSRTWHERIQSALARVDAVCTAANGLPRPWLHLLRAQAQHHLYPFDSSDSTNLAVNHHRYRHLPDHVSLFAKALRYRIEQSCDMQMDLPTPADNAIQWRWTELIGWWGCTPESDVYRSILGSERPPVCLYVPDYRAQRQKFPCEPISAARPQQPDLFAPAF